MAINVTNTKLCITSITLKMIFSGGADNNNLCDVYLKMMLGRYSLMQVLSYFFYIGAQVTRRVL